MSRMVKLVAILSLLGATAGTNIFARSACAWNCNTYYNSTPTYFQDYGVTCAYTGSGCRECVNRGYTSCVDTLQYPVCTDYPDYNGY